MSELEKRTILMGEAVISDADSIINPIGSFGASSCTLVFIQRAAEIHPQSYVSMPARGVVVHVDEKTDVQDFDRIFEKMRSQHPLAVTLFSEEFETKAGGPLLNYLAARNINYSMHELDADHYVVMDIGTGEITGTMDLDFEIPGDFIERMERRYQLDRKKGPYPIDIITDATNPAYDIKASDLQAPPPSQGL